MIRRLSFPPPAATLLPRPVRYCPCFLPRRPKAFTLTATAIHHAIPWALYVLFPITPSDFLYLLSLALHMIILRTLVGQDHF
jgi:hypothetical protein